METKVHYKFKETLEKSDKTSINALKRVCFNVQVLLEDRYLEVELLGHRICTSLTLSDNAKSYCINAYSYHKCMISLIVSYPHKHFIGSFLSIIQMHSHMLKNIFIFNLLFLFIIFHCCMGFLQLQRVRATLRCSAQAYCGGFSRSLAQALGSQASAAEAHRLSCPAACGVFPDQGSNPCPQNWKADS